jgi:UDP-N-acetylmuramate: L-alanyl-gamma-D-glutamyl-meso-diaminopimelate ligase
VPRDLPASFHEGSGERFVVEGDEYNAAYFDRGPKFLHYQPESLILTSVEHDHADLYPTPQTLWDAYAELLALLPAGGLLVACGDDSKVRELAASAPCKTVFYGLGEDNDLHPRGPVEHTPQGARFRVVDPEEGEREIALQLSGEHNVANALAVWAVARRDGLPGNEVARALAEFRGVKRRLEELASNHGVTVVDDFAHHPTAVGKTLAALRQRYPGRRLVVLYEPRSLTAGRRFFYESYRAAFAPADRVLLAPIFHAGRLAADEALDVTALAGELTAEGITATACASTDEVLAAALAEARQGTVLVTMSSGSFDGMALRLAERIRNAKI